MPRVKYPEVPVNPKLSKTPLKDIAPERRVEIAAEVMSRYLHGEQIAAMAPEYQTSDVTLYALLLRDHESEWKDAQIARSLAKLESSKQDLTDASDPLSLARAREHIRAAQWELERLLSRIFGVKQEVTHNVVPVFQVTLKAVDNSEGRVIEGEHMHVMSNSTPNEIKDLSPVDK